MPLKFARSIVQMEHNIVHVLFRQNCLSNSFAIDIIHQCESKLQIHCPPENAIFVACLGVQSCRGMRLQLVCHCCCCCHFKLNYFCPSSPRITTISPKSIECNGCTPPPVELGSGIHLVRRNKQHMSWWNQGCSHPRFHWLLWWRVPVAANKFWLILSLDVPAGSGTCFLANLPIVPLPTINPCRETNKQEKLPPSTCALGLTRRGL